MQTGVENRLFSSEKALNASLGAIGGNLPQSLFVHAKTGGFKAMATAASVKTEKLPNTYERKGHWYFKCTGAHVPLAGRPFDESFLGHYYELCRIFGVGVLPDDPRSVYFMGWEGGPIKIGLADSVKIRRDTLQVACPYELQVHAVTTGGLKAELDYHRKFKGRHLRGEWFERCPEIEAEIQRLTKSERL